MKKTVKTVLTIAVLLLMFTSCQQRYIFLPYPDYDDSPVIETPDTPEIPTVADENTYTFSGDFNFNNFETWLRAQSSAEKIKIKGNGPNTRLKLNYAQNEQITISTDLVLENLTVEGSAPEDGTDNPAMRGIVVSNQTKDVNIYLDGVTIKGFGHGINSDSFSWRDFNNSTVTTYKTNLYIIDSTFENCLKGLYINNLGTLQVFNSHFTKMGTLSEDGDGLTTRSGSAFDINQFAEGDNIVFYNSTFTGCGGGGTSGAIKIKVRGGSEETANDVPEKSGSLKSVLIQSCKFNNPNNRDLVLGTCSGSGDNKPKTSTYPKSLANNTRIIDTQLQILDESGNGYTLNSFTGN